MRASASPRFCLQTARPHDIKIKSRTCLPEPFKISRFRTIRAASLLHALCMANRSKAQAYE
eukprot:5440774-Karenia_brevis.AAC.1